MLDEILLSSTVPSNKLPLVVRSGIRKSSPHLRFWWGFKAEIRSFLTCLGSSLILRGMRQNSGNFTSIHGPPHPQNTAYRRRHRPFQLTRRGHARRQFEKKRFDSAWGFARIDSSRRLCHVEKTADGSILVDGQTRPLALHRSRTRPHQTQVAACASRARPLHHRRCGRRLAGTCKTFLTRKLPGDA